MLDLLAHEPFLIATSLVSIVCLGIFIWRCIYFWGKGAAPKALLGQVLGYTENRDYARAIQLCGSTNSPLGRILNAALSRANRSEREIRRAVESVALEEIPKVKAGTVYLPQFSNLATLFGLVGTIRGLIISFEGAGAENAATRQAMLSQGIAIAFYNTLLGLAVATLAILLYLVLLSKMNSTLAFMEQGAAKVVDAILWHRDESSDRKRSA